MKTEIFKDNVSLSVNFDKIKDIYIIKSYLTELPNNYLQYFCNPTKIQKMNDNIKEINIVEENNNYKILDFKININTSNINVGVFRKKEQIFIEKYDNGFYVYSKNIYIPNEIIKVKESYSVTHVYNYNGETKIDVLIEMVSDIPLILKKIPALIIIKTIINLQNKIQG